MSDSRFRELQREGDGHLDAATIGSYLDREGDVENAEAIRNHLDLCRRCFALYAELIRTRIVVKTRIGMETAPSDWVAAGLAVGAPESPAPRPASPQRRRLWRVAVPAVILLAVAAVLWLGRSGSYLPPPELREAVAGLGRDPGSSLLLVADLPDAEPVRRLGSAADPTAAREALDLVNTYNARRERGETIDESFAFWMIAGLLGTGRVDHARTYLDEVEHLFPDSWRIKVARAAVAFHFGDGEQALAILDSLGGDAERPIVLLNRILVLYEQGDLDAARKDLDRLRQAHAAPGLLDMAEGLLSGSGG